MDWLKPFLVSFLIGAVVGILYATLRVRSPAPPLVALTGLLGMVLAEGAASRALPLVVALFRR